MKKMTQKELGEQFVVTDKTISKWETGNGMPDLCFLKPLSDCLDITINTIQYTATQIKKNKFHMGIIFSGILLLTISKFKCAEGWGSILSLLLISTGIYSTLHQYKIRVSVLVFIGGI